MYIKEATHPAITKPTMTLLDVDPKEEHSHKTLCITFIAASLMMPQKGSYI